MRLGLHCLHGFREGKECDERWWPRKVTTLRQQSSGTFRAHDLSCASSDSYMIDQTNIIKVCHRYLISLRTIFPLKATPCESW